MNTSRSTQGTEVREKVQGKVMHAAAREEKNCGVKLILQIMCDMYGQCRSVPGCRNDELCKVILLQNKDATKDILYNLYYNATTEEALEWTKNFNKLKTITVSHKL